MKKLKKLFVLFIVFTIAISALNFVFAAETLSLNMDISTKAKKIKPNTKFTVELALNGDQTVFDSAQGIRIFKCGLRFDSKYFEIINPDTMEDVELNDEGIPTRMKNAYKFVSEVGMSGSLSVNMEDKETFVVLYSGTDPISDIYQSGSVVRFAFKVKSDIEISDSVSGKFELINPTAIGNSKDYEFDIQTKPVYISVIPIFSVSSIENNTIGETLEISGRFSGGYDANTPLEIKVYKDGDRDNILEEGTAEVSDNIFSFKFELNEEKYTAGTYRLSAVYGATSISRAFNIIAKPTPVEPTEPEPTDPDDGKKDDDKKDEDKKDDNTGGNTSGTTGGTTGGSGTNLSNKTNTGTDTKTDSDANKDGQNTNDTPKTYPADIDGHWAKSNIEYVYDNSLMNGYPDGSFAPENSITRAEFATVMSKLMGLDEDSAAADKFTDVDGHWAKGYIGALYSREIVNGISDTGFAPDANISRQEIATILARAFKLTEKSGEIFADNDSIADWASDFVYMTKAAGYMQGDENNNFNPTANATRAEVATIIYRLHSAK